MSRVGWLPALLGIVLGVALGLYYSWIVNPVEYVDTAPDSLRQDFKNDYLALIAAAYASSGDLVRAKARLALFPDLDAAATLGSLAQQRMAAGRPESEVAALAQLAEDLQGGPAPQATPGTIEGPTPSSTATLTPTPRPTPTPTATRGAPFELVLRERLCNPLLTEPLIQVEVVDSEERPVPGVEVTVLWDTGQDSFFTGLKPELGLGYADFTMTEGETYSLQLSDSLQPVTGLGTFECAVEGGETGLGSWILRFQQPALPNE